tara:strand:+ start:1077 stop:1496 length:420 start_codon:yes stop_codon:yes gene_type:complete
MVANSESASVKPVKAAFDYTVYLVSHEAETKTINIEGTTDSFEVSVKPLSWSKRNQLISKNLNWDSTGTTSFSADGYVRDCLKAMLVEAPWGRTTESLLLSFDDRLGAALETLVPKAFGEDADAKIGTELDMDGIKKEQ